MGRHQDEKETMDKIARVQIMALFGTQKNAMRHLGLAGKGHRYYHVRRALANEFSVPDTIEALEHAWSEYKKLHNFADDDFIFSYEDEEGEPIPGRTYGVFRYIDEGTEAETAEAFTAMDFD